MILKNNKIYIYKTNISDHDDIPQFKLLIPEPMRQKLISDAHCPPLSAHTGANKTIEKLERMYYWKTLKSDVRDFVASCDVCKTCKAHNFTLRPEMGAPIPVTRPWQNLYLDFIGPFPRSVNGNSHILIVLDQYSRFFLLHPCRVATAKVVTTFLENHVFLLFGIPERITTDYGKQFISKEMKDLLKKYGTSHINSPKYSPQSNISERANRTILSAIRSYINENHTKWDVHLFEIASALRNTIHDITKCTPHFLVFGQNMITHASEYELLRQLNSLDDNNIILSKSDRLNRARTNILEHFQKAHTKNMATYNLRARKRTPYINQKVFVKNFVQSNAGNKFCAKLAPKFIPATFVKIVGNVAVELKDSNGKNIGVFHLKDIKF